MEPIFAVGAASVALRVLEGRSALVSFAFIGSTFIPAKDVGRLCSSCSRVVLDSGAFSAWSKGSPIDLGAYLAHIEQHGERYGWIAALDAIGDWRASLDNWRTMLDALRPELARKIVPVFHEGEPIELLDEYAERATLVGLGRTDGRKSKPATFAFYDLAFNRQPSHRFHAFGNGSPETLEPYPFASFDCSTWERDSAYGGSHGWPWSAATKETRMRAYVEALSTLRYRGARQTSLEDLMHRPAPAEHLE